MDFQVFSDHPVYWKYRGIWESRDKFSKFLVYEGCEKNVQKLLTWQADTEAQFMSQNWTCWLKEYLKRIEDENIEKGIKRTGCVRIRGKPTRILNVGFILLDRRPRFCINLYRKFRKEWPHLAISTIEISLTRYTCISWFPINSRFRVLVCWHLPVARLGNLWQRLAPLPATVIDDIWQFTWLSLVYSAVLESTHLRHPTINLTESDTVCYICINY